MYEAVHAVPDGDSTVSRLAATAADYGFDGVVVRNHGDKRARYDPETVRNETGVDVVEGVEIRADGPEQASGYLGNYREKYVVLALHGGSPALNRFAVEQDRVDVLAHPFAGGGTFDHVMARAAADHDVRVEVNLGAILRTRGGRRVRAITALEQLQTLIEKYDTPYVVSADPHSHLQLRAPRDLLAVGEAIGFSEDQITDGLAEWARLATRNRERLSDAFIGPGVRTNRHEKEP